MWRVCQVDGGHDGGLHSLQFTPHFFFFFFFLYYLPQVRARFICGCDCVGDSETEEREMTYCKIVTDLFRVSFWPEKKTSDDN